MPLKTKKQHTRTHTGGASEAELERALCPERSTVVPSAPHGPAAGGGGLPLLANVRRASGVLHGPGEDVPGPGGQADQAAGGLS